MDLKLFLCLGYCKSCCNKHGHALFNNLFLFPLEIYPKVELLDHRVNLIDQELSLRRGWSTQLFQVTLLTGWARQSPKAESLRWWTHEARSCLCTENVHSHCRWHRIFRGTGSGHQVSDAHPAFSFLFVCILDLSRRLSKWQLNAIHDLWLDPW